MMPDAWSLNIRVVDQSANPIEMAVVSIRSSSVPMPDIAAMTGPDGQAAISVPSEGEYGVMVNAEGFPAVQKQIAAVNDSSISDVLLGN